MQGTARDITRVVAAAERGLRHHPDPGPALDRLAERLTEVVGRWDLVLEEVYGEGLGVPVVAVTTGGRPAVLKLEGTGDAFRSQVATLLAAEGRGYAAVLASDVDLGAVLLERLGPSLASAGLPPREQVAHLMGPVQRTWQLTLGAVPAGAPSHLPGGSKAEQLAHVLRTLPARVLSPEQREGWAPALAEAARLADHLAATRDPPGEVLCHGDPHPGNALLVPDAPAGAPAYRLVDPDGLVTEREYDLGVVLRDVSRELLASDGPGAARELHDALCRQAAAATGTDGERVRQWAFVERVTTGLYLQWFRDEDTAESFLDSAMLLCGVAAQPGPRAT
ncbi:aminoglycoside phosphotransferase family protein [Phycicoccus ginsengisoli]